MEMVQTKHWNAKYVQFAKTFAVRIGLLALLISLGCSWLPVYGQANPTGYWSFDSSSIAGTQVLDSSGHNLNGTSSGGVTSVAGEVNQALGFDGSSGSIQFPSDSLTSLTTNVSLAVWIRTQNNSRTESVISRYAAAGTESGYLLRSDSSGHMELRIGGTNSSTGYEVTLVDNGKVINDGQWHHIAVVITLGKGVTFYIDGQQSSTWALNVLGAGGGLNLEIGFTQSYPDYYGTYFTGALDELRIYNRVLAPSEIATLATSSSGNSGGGNSGGSSGSNPTEAGWANGYSYGGTITVAHGQVPNTDHTNFPVLVAGTFPALASVANGGKVTNANGYDILFTSDAAGLNKLNFERESYAPNGQVAFWVQIPLLSHSTDTTFYIFYGNAAVTSDPSNQNAAWDGNYAGVWHFSNGTASDSTGNHDNGSISGSTGASGVIAGAMNFNGASSYINFGNNLTKLEPSTALTISAWVNPNSSSQSSWANILDYDYSSPRGFPYVTYKLSPNNISGQPNNYEFELSTSGAGDSAVFSGVTPVAGTWAYVVGTYDGTSQKIFVNGVLKAQKSVTGNIAYPNGNFVLGANGALNQELWNGVTDEVRISSTARSADWIAAEYNNQSNPGGFYTATWGLTSGGSTPPPPPPPAPTITLSSTSLSFNATAGGVNPNTQSLSVSVSNGGAWTATSNEGWISLASSASGPWGSTVSGTGMQTVFVQVATNGVGLVTGTNAGSVTIAATGATPQTLVISFAIIAAPPPSGGSVPGTVGYWTFDSGTISGTTVLDSSGNNLTGKTVGGVTSTTGVLGQGLAFDGSSGAIQFPADNLTDLLNNISLALWIKTPNKSRTEALLSRYSVAGLEYGYVFRTDAAGHLEMRIGGNNNSTGFAVNLVDSGKLINDGQWHHVAAVITLGQGVSFYVDGALSSTQHLNVMSKAGASALEIGLSPVYPGYYGNYFTGSMDDVRIYNSALTATQVQTLAGASGTSSGSGGVNPPSLSLTPLSLSFSAVAGSSNPTPQALAISSSGSWTASTSQPWITLSANSGTGPATISVGAALSGLIAGAYSGSVTFSATGASQPLATLPVSLSLSSGTSSSGSGAQYFVSPSGSPSGDGSIGNPWDIQTALNQPASVQPSATIWLRSGVYGDGSTIFTSNLNGSSSQAIVVRQYPGERATINGGLVVNGSYSWFWGFEVTNTAIANRNSGTSGENPPANFPSGFTIYGSQDKFINLIVHDTAEGFGFWSAGQGGEISGSLIYNNGWQGTDRGHGHGHGIYTQNHTGTKYIENNILFQGFGEGIQAYGTSTAAYVENFVFDGNTIFNSGGLQSSGFDYNLLVTGGIGGPQNIAVTNSYTYFTPSARQGLSALDLGGPTATNLTAANNYWIGGEPAIEFNSWTDATFTNETIYAPPGEYLMFAGSLNPSTYTWGQNTYFGANGIELNGSGQTFAGWQSATGLDLTSSYTAAAPTGTWIFVRPNQYESGRANITVYNWGLANSVSVDVSNVLTVGQHYVVKNAQDYFNAPIASGTYQGGTISIPMSNLSAASPVGVTPVQPTTTGPQFGAFILLAQ